MLKGAGGGKENVDQQQEVEEDSWMLYSIGGGSILELDPSRPDFVALDLVESKVLRNSKPSANENASCSAFSFSISKGKGDISQYFLLCSSNYHTYL